MLALYIVAAIVLFIFLVIAIPVDLALDVGGAGVAKPRVRIGWLFGLLGKDLGRTSKKPKEPAPKKKKTKKKRSAAQFLSVLAAKGVASGLVKLARRIFGAIRVRHLDARLRIGLDDPAATGMLYSALWPVLVPLTYDRAAKVRLELSFEGPVLDLAAHGRIRVFPIQMVWSVLLFALSPAGLRGMKRMMVRR